MATNFFQRWSSRKLAAREEPTDTETEALQAFDESSCHAQSSDIKEQTSEGDVEVPACNLEVETGSDTVAVSDVADEETTLTLKDVTNVTFESGVTSFMKTGVEKSVKKAALRKLFHSDEFNYVSDMDDHTEDFSNVPTLDSSVTKQLRNWVNQASEKLEDVSETLAQTASDESVEMDLAEAEALASPTEQAELTDRQASIPTSTNDLEIEAVQEPIHDPVLEPVQGSVPIGTSFVELDPPSETS